MRKQTRIPATVDEYIVQLPEPARTTLQTVRNSIRLAAPRDATEVISYKMPAFRFKKILVWFAAFQDHCSLFPGASVVKTLEEDLKGYSIAKGTIRFPLDKPLPASLIKKLVKARLKEISAED